VTAVAAAAPAAPRRLPDLHAGQAERDPTADRMRAGRAGRRDWGLS
jgi:hypothetical protein